MSEELNTEHERKHSGNDEYEELRAELLSKFDTIIDEVGRSHQRLYSFLGYVYAAANRIDASRPLRVALEIDVERIVNDARPGKRKWKAFKHDSYDLLLTLRTKLAADLASSKSGWLQSLRAASELKDAAGNPAPVEATESAFVEWITPKGVSGARKLAKPTSTFNLCEFAEGMAPSGTFTIDLPNSAKPPEGLIEVLARVRNQGLTTAEVEVIGIILDEKRIRSSSAWLFSHIEKSNRVYARKFEKAVEKYKKSEYGDPGAPDIVPDVELSAEEMQRIAEQVS